jgi:3-deoxy-D-manno-octulosonic-acid transferase
VPAPLDAAYELVARLATTAATVAPAGDSKLLRSLRGRRNLLERYHAWSPHRDKSRELLWMHAPSVGEGLQARPVLERLRADHPHIQLAYTYFSPSAQSFAERLNVDFRDFLPFDTRRAAARALEAIRPTALVFSKLDVWPTLTREASARGVPLGLVSATLASGSSRRGALASSLLRSAYARLDRVGAIDADDAERLAQLGVRREAIAVTGDTRYDQVWARAQRVDTTSPILGPLLSRRTTLVAGSTWPADERVLLPVWGAVRRASPEIRLIIAPHEPTSDHLAPIERWANSEGLAASRMSAPSALAADVVIVDRVGVLGDLYALADVAFVGGGFHSAGLHSVIEPAAFGAPVLFGPQWAGSRDARLLLNAGAAAAPPDRTGFERALRTWLQNAGERESAGARAKELVRSGLGAAERTVKLVLQLLGETA